AELTGAATSGDRFRLVEWSPPAPVPGVPPLSPEPQHGDSIPPASIDAGGRDPPTPAEHPARAQPGADAVAGHPGVGRGRDDDLLPAAVAVPGGRRRGVRDVADRRRG